MSEYFIDCLTNVRAPPLTTPGARLNESCDGIVMARNTFFVTNENIRRDQVYRCGHDHHALEQTYGKREK